jgi:hypothetical protein
MLIDAPSMLAYDWLTQAKLLLRVLDAASRFRSRPSD